MTEPIRADVTVKKLYNIKGKLSGFGLTASGDECYIPSRFVPGLQEGETFDAELQPNTRDSRSERWKPPKYVVSKINGQAGIPNRSRNGTRRYDSPNIVERHSPQGA